MEENQRKEFIKKLAESRENINLLQNMLKREQWNVEQELKLVSEAKRYIDEILFELTGDKFYKKAEGLNENRK
jgi:hypothetical protein